MVCASGVGSTPGACRAVAPLPRRASTTPRCDSATKQRPYVSLVWLLPILVIPEGSPVFSRQFCGAPVAVPAASLAAAAVASCRARARVLWTRGEQLLSAPPVPAAPAKSRRVGVAIGKGGCAHPTRGDPPGAAPHGRRGPSGEAPPGRWASPTTGAAGGLGRRGGATQPQTAPMRGGC